MTVDNLIKYATGLTVTAVAGFAAVVSYGHLYDVSGHQALLPLCVDGMMVASSLVLLAAARAKLEAIPLARATLWLGISATILGNVAYALPWLAPAPVVDAWPAVCFVMTVETVMQLAKTKRTRRVKPALVQPVGSESGQDDLVPALLDKGNYPPELDFLSASTFKVPGIKAIMTGLHCGQPIAYEVQGIMKEQNVDMHKALLLRNEAKANVNP